MQKPCALHCDPRGANETRKKRKTRPATIKTASKSFAHCVATPGGRTETRKGREDQPRQKQHAKAVRIAPNHDQNGMQKPRAVRCDPRGPDRNTKRKTEPNTPKAICQSLPHRAQPRSKQHAKVEHIELRPQGAGPKHERKTRPTTPKAACQSRAHRAPTTINAACEGRVHCIATPGAGQKREPEDETDHDESNMQKPCTLHCAQPCPKQHAQAVRIALRPRGPGTGEPKAPPPRI